MKKQEWLKYTDKDGEDISFPVITIEGAKPGPHVVITGGLHGCEYPGIAAAIALSRELTPEAVCGRVTIVTISSVKAFEARSMFVCPIDKKNPNRFFPGEKGGSYTDAMVNYLYENIIVGADYHLDLHGGDMVEALDPFCLYHVGVSKENDEKCRDLALYYGLPNIIPTRSGGSWPDKGTNYANSAEHGIPSIIAEVGNYGQMEKADIEMHLHGIRNVLRHLSVIGGDVETPCGITEYDDFVWLYTPVKGIFYCEVRVGDSLQEGQCVGRMEDYFGKQLMELKAPVKGKILFLTTSPAMKENGLIMGIGVK